MSNSSFEAVLERDGSLVYPNVGTSMMPLLRQGRDLMVIQRRPEGRCKKYDAVLYKRPNGQYVMHRILKVRRNDYVICGDNRWKREFGVPDEWIIGVLTAVIRDGKTIPVTDRKYRLYVHFWCDFFWIRAGIVRAKGILNRRLKKWKK